MCILFKGGTVVGANGAITADLLVEGERIAAIEEELSPNGREVVDVRGKLLFPGFIDAHTHFDLDVCGTTTADDFVSGGRSALCGGTTTVIDFACPDKGETLSRGLSRWHEKADGRCACDYGFHMTIDDWNAQIRSELPEMFRAGVSSFKMYTTYPAMMLPDEEILDVLRELRKYGGIAGIHCENSEMIDALTQAAKKEGRTAPEQHPLVRPPEAEADAVRRMLRLAAIADVPLVIVHLSAQKSLAEAQAARERGQTVFVETCPQYLLLTDEVYQSARFDSAAGYICAPPIRKKADCDALWAALRSGEIQTVSTDHCSFTRAQKNLGRDDFTKIPGGLPGVETRGILLYSEGVHKGRITKERMCALLAENPARLYGLYPKKGVLAVGSDADLVVIDPDATGVISAQMLHSNARYTPFEGTAVHGAISSVYLRGTRVFGGGEVPSEAGKYLPRGISTL